MSESAPALYPLGPALDFMQRIWQLNHAIERLSLTMERRLGVTAQQRLVVRALGKFPGITAGHLARVLHLDPGTVSAALNRLDEKGLVDRRRNPRDRRRSSLALTSKGRALDLPATGTVEAAVERLLAGASRADLLVAEALLARLVALLEEGTRETRD